ncbi:super-infection exclusion protein B [Enterococcus faecalis]|uniref:super-infection exclusion protein B n=1 Tax=Enterococcus faecalis TaxID=1351 RepID=UPI002DB6ECD6|nr:super-infection exclusion protein B [Enterococcus faecalis]MEB7488024.1 superinfection exclusion B family protein [Enterococcus faecalis]
MLNLKVIDKIIDFLNNPLNKGIFWCLGIVSFIVLGLNVVLPKEQLQLIYIDSFLNKYGWTLPIIFLVSVVFLIVGFFSKKVQENQEKIFQAALRKEQNKLLEDELALVYLAKLYQSHPNPVQLPITNQKVKLLEQYHLIVRVMDQMPIYGFEELSNPHFPYVLQPYAEEKLKEKYNYYDN